MSFDKYLTGLNDSLQISDKDGELQSLSDNFFEAYTHLKSLSIITPELTSLPASFALLTQLERLHLGKTKLKALPDSIAALKELQSLNLETNLIDLNKEIPKLVTLPKLETLYLNGYRGSVFPSGISQLKGLKKISIAEDLKKKYQFHELIATLAPLPVLEEVEIGAPVQSNSFNEDFLQLDKPMTIHSRGGWTAFYLGKPEEWPLFLGLTQQVLLTKQYDEVLLPFRQRFYGKDVPRTQRELLFGIYVRNYTALNTVLKNALSAAIKENKAANLILLDKLKGESGKSIREKLQGHSITLGEQTPENNIVVIGPGTTLEEAEPYVLNGYTFITVDHLKEALINLADPWLMQEDNSSSNDNLVQLLVSNQIENFQIAFQIVEQGGANKTVQSLLAAIMLAHPEASIYKAAEKLYNKYGSESFKQHIKKLGLSLRMSGNSDSKVASIARHVDIDKVVFLLMHHRIAAANKNIADVEPQILRIFKMDNPQIPDILPFFTDLRTIHYNHCINVQLDQAIPKLQQLPTCKILVFEECEMTVPASIGQLTHLEHLELGFTQVPQPETLGNLKNLKKLNLEGTKLTKWDWLSSLPQLEDLNVNNCALPEIPQEVYSLTKLKSLEAKQNKIKNIDPAITNIVDLRVLDLSNNQLRRFPYVVGNLRQLSVLRLRSNAIGEFDAATLKQEGNITTQTWTELDLSRTGLKTFELKEIQLPVLQLLDISNNELSVLDDSIFRSKTLKELYAENNQISVIPPSISNITYFTKLWIHKNKIQRLEDYMARIHIENADFTDNQIDFIHPDFDTIGKDRHARLYWKIKNNPISRSLSNFGGLYGHK